MDDLLIFGWMDIVKDSIHPNFRQFWDRSVLDTQTQLMLDKKISQHLWRLTDSLELKSQDRDL